MTVNDQIVAAVLTGAFGVIAYFFLYVLRSLKGLSRKINKILAMLSRWPDLDVAERRRQVSHIQEGK